MIRWELGLSHSLTQKNPRDQMVSGLGGPGLDLVEWDLVEWDLEEWDLEEPARQWL